MKARIPLVIGLGLVFAVLALGLAQAQAAARLPTQALSSELLARLGGRALGPAAISSTVYLRPQKDAAVLESDPAAPHGGDDDLATGNCPTAARTLIYFDLSSIPPGARIDYAMLGLYVHSSCLPGGSDPPQVNVHRVLWAWQEWLVCWTTQPLYSVTPYVREWVGPAGSWSHWIVTTLIREWHQGEYPNHGLILVATRESGGNRRVFGSSESTMQPYLTVTYSEMTATPTRTSSATAAPSAASTPTPTPTAPTATRTRTRTPSPAASSTSTPTYTPVPTASATATVTPTPTASPTGPPVPRFGDWDGNRVAAPCVISDTGKYRMWYDGYNPSYPGAGWSVGLAESSDGVHWTKHDGSPVLGPGSAGAWDQAFRFQVAVLKDDADYKLWFSGGGSPVQTGYATSGDGIHWDVYYHRVVPVGPSGSWDESEADGPTVIKDDGEYKMWYHGCNADSTACGIGYATSFNGRDWVKWPGNPALVGTPGAWDENRVLWPSVVKNGSVYEMWYSSNGKIGRATSSDGAHWVKSPDNPVLAAGWDGSIAVQPSVLLEGGAYKMWFRNGPPANSSIGFAESPDGIHWTLSPSNPVLTPGKAGEVHRLYLPLALESHTFSAPDLIFYNGDVITMENAQPLAQAIAIRGERIVSVGSNAAVLALRGPDTRVVDLGGRALLPGFIDGHTHVLRHAGSAGKTLDEAIDLLLRHGLTGVTEMSGDMTSIHQLEIAEREGRLRLRVNVFPSLDYPYLDESGRWMFAGEWFREHGPILDSTRRLRIPGVKIFEDGAGVGARGCPAMAVPYPGAESDPTFYDVCFNARGDLYLNQQELNYWVGELQARGYRVAFHAMGDRAIDTVLNAIEYALDGAPNSRYRHQIEHNSFLRSDQIDRYISLGILASVRATWNTCDQAEYREGWPSLYTQWANRFALPGRGVRAYVEGDFGWATDPEDRTSPFSIDPLTMLWALATHQQLRPDGTACEPEPWVAQNQITVPQALRMLTIEPAYAVSQEGVLGSLKPGKFADLVVLSANPLTVSPDAIKDIQVLMTMVGGRAEYCAEGQAGVCPAR